jgi:hypothetical protein
MKKWQGVAASSVILLSAATTFSFPLQKTHRNPFRMLPHSAVSARATKSAGGVVTHLVLDSAVEEGNGSISVIKAFYNEKGRLDSNLRIEDDFTMQAAFFFNAKGTIDSMLQQTRSKGDLTHQIKWFFTEPISQIFFSSMADELSEGQGVTMHSDFSPQLSMTAGYGKEWDSTSHEWHYYGKDTLINHNNDVKIYHYYEWDTDSNSWQISELDTITISDDKITRVIEHYRFDSTWYRHRYSYLYDEHGNVFEFSQEKLEIPSRSWVLYLKVKYTNEYNAYNNQTSSRAQEWISFTGTWTSLDSSRFAFHSYTYDSSGSIITRTDSVMNYWDDDPSKITHHFQYQTFSAPVIPRNASKITSRQPITVSSDGKIKLQSLSTVNLSATLYTLSGRSICRIPLRSDIRLNDYCAQNNILPGSGVSLLRITSDKTGQHIGEWKVFLR